MSKHTPAPWHNGLDASGNPIVCQKYDGDLLGYEPNEEYQANCRLVSAAPELLEELENCVDLLVTCFPDVHVDSCVGAAITKGNSAIAKAKGANV